MAGQQVQNQTTRPIQRPAPPPPASNSQSNGNAAAAANQPKPTGIIDSFDQLFSNGGDYSSAVSNINNIASGIGTIVNGINFFQQADDMKPEDAALGGVMAGASMGTAIMPGWGTAIGAVVGGIGGLVSSLFGGGKSKEHKERDAVRDWLRQNTALGADLQFEGFTGDGQTGVISLDGKSHKVDNSQGVLAQATGMTNVLAATLAGGNPRLQADVSAMFLNAISGSRNFDEALGNVRSLMGKIGLNPEALAKGMVAMYQKGAFPAEQLQEHLAYIDIIAGNKPGPSSATPEAADPNVVAPDAEAPQSPASPDMGIPADENALPDAHDSSQDADSQRIGISRWSRDADRARAA